MQRTVYTYEKKTKLIETISEGAQLLALIEKDIEMVILNMFKEIHKIVPKKLEECMTMTQNLKNKKLWG